MKLYSMAKGSGAFWPVAVMALLLSLFFELAAAAIYFESPDENNSGTASLISEGAENSVENTDDGWHDSAQGHIDDPLDNPVSIKDSQKSTDKYIGESNEDISSQTGEPFMVSVYFRKTGETVLMDLEEYLIGVVAAEMPASFDIEALKAQAAACRTYAMYRIINRWDEISAKHPGAALCTDSSHCCAYNDDETMKSRWGVEYEKYRAKIGEAVSSTAGMAITYDNKVIDAVFSANAGGRTEDAADVWGSEIPYLVSVSSDGDELYSSTFISSSEFTVEEARTLLNKKMSGLSLSDDVRSWFGAATYTEGGAIATIEIGGKIFTGAQLRSAFSLKSKKITIRISGEKIRFFVRGYGHGVGMSQYGAQGMALSGKTWEDILLWYYRGTEIISLSAF